MVCHPAEAHLGHRLGTLVTAGICFLGPSISLPGSPLAILHEQIAAELAAGRIPCACPHPVTADRLSLPGRVLACADCTYALTFPEVFAAAAGCSCCGASARMRFTGWAEGSVLVIARVCDSCADTPISPN